LQGHFKTRSEKSNYKNCFVKSTFFALPYISNIFLGIPVLYSIIIGTGIVLAYDTVGGMRAVVATDVSCNF
jgi:Na+/proline symporter